MSGGWNRPRWSTMPRRSSVSSNACSPSRGRKRAGSSMTSSASRSSSAKAISLPAEVLQRVLLFWSPWVGQPVDRICELADLYDEVSTDAARRLIAIWREDEPIQQEPVAWRRAAENARRALSEVSRRPDLAHDAGVRSGER